MVAERWPIVVAERWPIVAEELAVAEALLWHEEWSQSEVLLIRTTRSPIPTTEDPVYRGAYYRGGVAYRRGAYYRGGYRGARVAVYRRGGVGYRGGYRGGGRRFR